MSVNNNDDDKSAPQKVRSTTAWDNQYQKVAEFFRIHHHTNIPRKGTNAPLAKWLGKQRANKDKLSEEQVEKLNAVKFEWQTKKVLDDLAWKERFERLRAYKQVHGHVDVPQKFPQDVELGTWVANQRRRYNQNTLRQDRKELLDTLNFNFLIKGGNKEKRSSVVNGKYDAIWEQQFQRLVKYKEQHGHTNIPQNCEGDLGMWVSTQRRYYNKKTWIPEKGMREDRKAKLDSIGFEWNRGPSNTKKRSAEQDNEDEDEHANKKLKQQHEEAMEFPLKEDGVDVQELVNAVAHEQDVAAVVDEEVENAVKAAAAVAAADAAAVQHEEEEPQPHVAV